MTQDEKEIAKAKEDIAEKGADSQTEKDRIDESEGAKKADEKRAEEKNEGAGLDAKIDALIGRMDKLIATFEARAEAKDDKMARAAEKYGLAPSGAGETPKKSYTDEDVKKLLG